MSFMFGRRAVAYEMFLFVRICMIIGWFFALISSYLYFLVSFWDERNKTQGPSPRTSW